MTGEWLKLRKQRSFVWLSLFSIVACVGVSTLACSILSSTWKSDPAGALNDAVSMPSAGVYIAGLLLGLGVCIWLANEFVSGSNYLTLLAVPRRNLVFSARLVLVGILSVVFGCIVALVGSLTGLFFFGYGYMSKVVAEGAFWVNVLATIVVALSMLLFFFAAATLARRSLPAVGMVATLLFLLPIAEGFAEFFKFTLLARVLTWLPGDLINNAMAVPANQPNATFSPLVASFLLMLWCSLFVVGAGWRFARSE